ESLWTTMIHLPREATLKNPIEIADGRWRIDFGGGNSMTATTAVQGGSTIIVDEKSVVTEEQIGSSPEEILSAFGDYKTFDIQYTTPHSMIVDSVGTGPTAKKPFLEDWSVNFGSVNKRVNLSLGQFHGFLDLSMTLSTTTHLGWDLLCTKRTIVKTCIKYGLDWF